MAARSKATRTRSKPAAGPGPANDQGELSLTDLARGVLAKEIRPRVGDIRRLAEAVLAGGGAKAKKAKADGGKKKDKNRSDEKSGKKNKKMAKIPGQQTKN